MTGLSNLNRRNLLDFIITFIVPFIPFYLGMVPLISALACALSDTRHMLVTLTLSPVGCIKLDNSKK